MKPSLVVCGLQQGAAALFLAVTLPYSHFLQGVELPVPGTMLPTNYEASA